MAELAGGGVDHFTGHPGHAEWRAAEDWSWTQGMDDELKAAVVAGVYYTTVLALRGPMMGLAAIVGEQARVDEPTAAAAVDAIANRRLIKADGVRWVRSGSRTS